MALTLFHSIHFTSGFYNHPPHDVPRVLRGRRMKQMSQLGLSTPQSINFFDQLRVFVLTATHCKRSFSEEGWKWTSLWLEVKYWEGSLKPRTFSGVVVVSLLPGPMASSTAGPYLSRFTVGTWVERIPVSHFPYASLSASGVSSVVHWVCLMDALVFYPILCLCYVSCSSDFCHFSC